MRIGIYARVSTADKGQDVGLQVRELEAYAHARGWSIREIYVDEGVSGSQIKRPALDRLMAACRRRQLDAVLVWRLDRLGRSLKHLITTLDELRTLGVAFVSLHEQLDCTTATGQLLIHLLAAFAEFERAIIKERVRAGLQNARAKGRRLGRPTLSVDKLHLKQLRKQGLSIRQIAECLKISAGSVHKTLLAGAA
jgi:DNA invertase Pin-like site-specific DNA recombinase